MEDISVALLVISIALLAVGFYAAAAWTVFEKAGRRGWEALIPFYNLYVMTQIIGKSGWFTFLYFLPVVEWFAWAITAISLSKKFGRSEAFGFGLFFLAPVFLPILAWSKESALADLPGSNQEQEADIFVNEDGETVERIPVEKWDA